MSRWVPILCLLSALYADERPEQVLGVVVEASGARLLRAGTELALGARNGDLLFSDDSLLVESGVARILFCPDKVELTLRPPATVSIRASALRIRSETSPARKPVETCLLPKLERATAGERHYGGSLTRALEEPGAPERVQTEELPPAQRAALAAQLEPIDRVLAGDPQNVAARLSRLALLEQYGRKADLIAEYENLTDVWPDAEWVRNRLFVHEKQVGRSRASSRPTLGGGKTYALLVGVSKYQRIPEWLDYAHQDAIMFADYLRSPRGGSLPSSDIVLLTNEKATTAAVKNAFETFLKARAGKNDTVVLFIAAHGWVERSRGAYILTYDSDPQDLASTALSMALVQTLVREDLSHIGHLLVYVDVCRAGHIGAIRAANTVNNSVERLAEADGDLFLFLASGPKELSWEGPQYGGGHGAFSYFVMDALNGNASDTDGDGVVTLGELTEYVQEKVKEATFGAQHPREGGSMERGMTLAEARVPGIVLAGFSGPKRLSSMTQAGRSSLRNLDRSGAGLQSLADSAPQRGELEEAISAGRILPDDPQSAFSVLRSLRRQLSPEQFLIEQNKLRVALEDAGQQVLLRYLAGEEDPQDRSDFLRGAAYFKAAQFLTPESLFLESRASFLSGRAALFDKEYRRAIDLLEHAARLDANGAYSYNALGIAYLEQAEYNRAIQAFRDATRLAPNWAYPLHNLALAYSQTGEYNAAIRAYQTAMDLAPRYSYLPYNLGLMYQRLNRRKEAETAFRKALELAPQRGEPYNALGYLYASSGHEAEAERLYRQALNKNPELLAARQNLAVLLSTRSGQFDAAVRLWRENLTKSADYLPSRLSLARALARRNEPVPAIVEYEQVVRQKPEYVGARLALADLYLLQGAVDAARDQLLEAARLQPDNAEVLEKLGDAEQARGRPNEAVAAYRQALQSADDSATRKRLRGKMK
jgi:tetratricopeptide (TPR) repeat protein